MLANLNFEERIDGTVNSAAVLGKVLGSNPLYEGCNFVTFKQNIRGKWRTISSVKMRRLIENATVDDLKFDVNEVSNFSNGIAPSDDELPQLKFQIGTEEYKAISVVLHVDATESAAKQKRHYFKSFKQDGTVEKSILSPAIKEALIRAGAVINDDTDIVKDIITVELCDRSKVDSKWKDVSFLADESTSFLFVSRSNNLIVTDGKSNAYKVFDEDIGYVDGKKVITHVREKILLGENAQDGSKNSYLKTVEKRKRYIFTYHSASGRNRGIFYAVRADLLINFEKALSGYLFEELKGMAESYPDFVKKMKYQNLSSGAKAKMAELDLDKYCILLVHSKNDPNDKLPLLGDGCAVSNIPGLNDKTPYQSRIMRFGKGILDNNKYKFVWTYNYIQKLVDAEKVKTTLYGNKKEPPVAIIDLNFFKLYDKNKMEDYELLHANWVISIARAERESLSHVKLMRRFEYNKFERTVEYMINDVRDQIVDLADNCFTPQPNSQYIGSMLRGMDRAATNSALESVLGENPEDLKHIDDPQEEDPYAIDVNAEVIDSKAEHTNDESAKEKVFNFEAKLVCKMDEGKVLKILQSRIHNDKPDTEIINEKKYYIGYVNQKSYRTIKRFLAIRFPSTGLAEMVRIKLIVDNNVSDGAIEFAITEEIQEMLEILGGADCDGDEVHLLPLEDKNGKDNFLCEDLDNTNYEPELIHNIMPHPNTKWNPDKLHRNKYVFDCANSGVNQAGILIGAANELLYAPYAVVERALCKAEANNPYEERFANAGTMSEKDIFAWIEYVMNKFKHVESVSEMETFARTFHRDLMKVASWCAEVATGIASNGTGVDAEIVKFFGRAKATFKKARLELIEENKEDLINKTTSVHVVDEAIEDAIAETWQYANDVIKSNSLDFVSKSVGRNFFYANRFDKRWYNQWDEEGKQEEAEEMKRIRNEYAHYALVSARCKDKTFSVWKYVEGLINSQRDAIKQRDAKYVAWGICGKGTHLFAREYAETMCGYTGLENLDPDKVREDYDGTDLTILHAYDTDPISDDRIIKEITNPENDVTVTMSNGRIYDIVINGEHVNKSKPRFNKDRTPMFYENTRVQRVEQPLYACHSFVTRCADGTYSVDRVFYIAPTENHSQGTFVMCMHK